MFQIEGYDYEFKIKDLNALEVLAFRTQIDFRSMEAAQNLFEAVLQRIQVKAGENWIPCLDNGVFYPAVLANDTNLMNDLIKYFMNEVLKPVFPKSSESKE